jgi:hypothetical protein
MPHSGKKHVLCAAAASMHMLCSYAAIRVARFDFSSTLSLDLTAVFFGLNLLLLSPLSRPAFSLLLQAVVPA